MPDALVDVVGSRTASELRSIATNEAVPLLGFEVPDGAREETRADQVKQTGGNDEEVL